MAEVHTNISESFSQRALEKTFPLTSIGADEPSSKVADSKITKKSAINSDMRLTGTPLMLCARRSRTLHARSALQRLNTKIRSKKAKRNHSRTSVNKGALNAGFSAYGNEKPTR